MHDNDNDNDNDNDSRTQAGGNTQQSKITTHIAPLQGVAALSQPSSSNDNAAIYDSTVPCSGWDDGALLAALLLAITVVVATDDAGSAPLSSPPLSP